MATLAFVGFFVGIRERRQPASPREYPSNSSLGEAPLARSHEELSRRPWSTEARVWTPDTRRDVTPVSPRNSQAKSEALKARARGRAFEGAPPTIPHPVGQASGIECRACHERGATIGEAVAPPWSHAHYTMCTQCHVSEMPPLGTLDNAAAVANSFVGVRGAAAPYRAYEGSPPQIPHTTLMRERCSSCHGPHGRPGLQTSHPERLDCRQCHAPAASLDQRQPR